MVLTKIGVERYKDLISDYFYLIFYLKICILLHVKNYLKKQSDYLKNSFWHKRCEVSAFYYPLLISRQESAEYDIFMSTIFQQIEFVFFI